MSAADQSSEAMIGCCIGQALIVAEGLGFPNSSRPVVLGTGSRK